MALYEKELEKVLAKLTESVANTLGLENNETVNAEDEDGFLCLRCGCRIYSALPRPFEYCPSCGRKVVEVGDE